MFDQTYQNRQPFVPIFQFHGSKMFKGLIFFSYVTDGLRRNFTDAPQVKQPITIRDEMNVNGLSSSPWRVNRNMSSCVCREELYIYWSRRFLHMQILFKQTIYQKENLPPKKVAILFFSALLIFVHILFLLWKIKGFRANR